VKLPPVYTGGYVAAPVKAWLFQDHVQSISGMLITATSGVHISLQDAGKKEENDPFGSGDQRRKRIFQIG
jgi:hypothetical protein